MQRSEPSRRCFLQAFAGAAVGSGALSVPGVACAAEGTPAFPESWQMQRIDILNGWLELLGSFPAEIPPMDPEVEPVDPIEGIECRHISFRSEKEGPEWLSHVTALMLVPDCARDKQGPAVICIHPTTMGAGKRAAVGLCGRKPDDPPLPPGQSRAYGLELARWGYLTLSIDLICDGERIPPGSTDYDTSEFYRLRPGWSAIGKNTWDVMRSVDYLCASGLADPNRIACVGHSLGGHSSLFAVAFDKRIAAAICNGGVYSWRRNESHWCRPELEKPQRVESYVYIRKFRPYLDDLTKPVPADFDGLMACVAPRPLLLMQTEGEMRQDDTMTKAAHALEAYRRLGSGDRIGWFSYPGEHNYPPDAKRLSFSWLDRWFGHTPAVSTIWTGQTV